MNISDPALKGWISSPFSCLKFLYKYSMKEAHQLPNIIKSNDYFEDIESRDRLHAKFLIERGYIVDTDDIESLESYIVKIRSKREESTPE